MVARIALALDYFDPKRGGSEAWVADFAAWVAQKNYEVLVVATGGIPTASLQLHIAAAPPQPWKRARILTPFAQSLGADIIHDTGVLLAADVFHPHVGSRTLNLKRELSARSLKERARLAVSPAFARWRLQTRFLEKCQLRSARKIIAASRLVVSDICQMQSSAAGKVETIPFGIDTTRFGVASAENARLAARRKFVVNDEVLFVMSAHNFLLKGVRVVIDALASFTIEERLGVKVLVAGNGEIKRYQNYAAKRDVANQIRFIGYVADTAELYRAADVALHPTFHDSCSLSTLEAIASCVPVITTALNGAADFIDQDKDGIILPSPDSLLLAQAMRRMFSASQRNLFREALKSKVGKVSQHINFTRIEEIYRQILLERGNIAC